MKPHADNYDAIIAGGGPAGASAAIHLARGGVRVLLIEQKKFPRAKLCGEFISPECQVHFEKLGVAGAMAACGAALLDETVFYSSKGHHVAVPSKWFGGGRAALGLSRAVMDEVLLRSAHANGVVVHEGASITEPILDGKRVAGVRVKIDGRHHEFRAPITIDATGRTRILSRKIHHASGNGGNSRRPNLVAFKAHLTHTRVMTGACEIYFYPGGYGGLSTVEAGTSNLCFIIAAEHVKRCNSDPEVVLREFVMKNQRAAYTLETAEVCSEWLSASWERFGRQRPSPAPGLLAIGDSAAFIDPFTGSGMLMAFESGELVAQTILRHQTNDFTELEADYTAAYRRAFDSRLRICGLLRRAAFSPRLTELGIAMCGASERFRNRLARATRAHPKSHKFLPHNSLLE
jgi:menaquinone-9 beta-reductase